MIRLIINWAPLTGARASRQQTSWNNIAALMSTNGDFVASTVVCPGEATEGVPGEPAVLPRSIGVRHLPYVNDILDHARRLSSPDDWIGFVNSDIILTQQFVSRVRASAMKFVMCNVTDINDRWRVTRFRPARGGSIDGIFMKASVWDEIREKVPPLVLGSRAWDTAFVMWSFVHLDSSEWCAQGDCLHPVHDMGPWAQENDEACKTNLDAMEVFGGLKVATALFCKSGVGRMANLRRRMRNGQVKRRGAPYRNRP